MDGKAQFMGARKTGRQEVGRGYETGFERERGKLPCREKCNFWVVRRNLQDR
jgi:hypothetical protein